MTTMIAEVYDALREAGASEEKARQAAEAVAQADVRFVALDTRLTRMAERLETVATKADLEALRGDARTVAAQNGMLIRLFWILLGLAVATFVKAFF